MGTEPWDAILEFWLGPQAEREQPAAAVQQRWWAKDSALDDLLRTRFGGEVERAAAGDYDGWLDTARGRLAVVILLDQFTRNIHRDRPAMYAHDPLALRLSREGLSLGQDRDLYAAERQFLYMPLMHAEELEAQERCVALFEQLAAAHPHMQQNLKFAVAHRDIIARFGRFPHRNALLDRTSSAEERAFLKAPGSSF